MKFYLWCETSVGLLSDPCRVQILLYVCELWIYSYPIGFSASVLIAEARLLSRYSDWLRAGQSGDRIPVGSRFSAPVQTGPGAHPASCTMGTGSLPEVKSGRGVALTPHPLLVPWSWKGRAIPLLPLWAVRPVQSLSACTRVTFTFTFTFMLTVEASFL